MKATEAFELHTKFQCPNWKWNNRLRMQSPLGLGIPLLSPFSSTLSSEVRIDLFWVALKDKTKTNMAGKLKNLPCEKVNSLLLEAF